MRKALLLSGSFILLFAGFLCIPQSKFSFVDCMKSAGAGWTCILSRMLPYFALVLWASAAIVAFAAFRTKK